jgi:hypothetical protein
VVPRKSADERRNERKRPFGGGGALNEGTFGAEGSSGLGGSFEVSSSFEGIFEASSSFEGSFDASSSFEGILEASSDFEGSSGVGICEARGVFEADEERGVGGGGAPAEVVSGRGIVWSK